MEKTYIDICVIVLSDGNRQMAGYKGRRVSLTAFAETQYPILHSPLAAELRYKSDSNNSQLVALRWVSKFPCNRYGVGGRQTNRLHFNSQSEFEIKEMGLKC